MKILICLSGQSRGINVTNPNNQATLLNGIKRCFGDFEYDIIGHTWIDQELPTEVTPYLKVARTSQDDITNWVRKAPWDRLPEVPNWQSNEELVNMPDSEVYTFLLERAKGAYGQIWSYWESMRMADTLISALGTKYDAIVRYRWDTAPGSFGYETTNQKSINGNIDLFKYEFVKWVNNGYKIHNNEVNVLCAHPYITGLDPQSTGFIPDHMFVIQPSKLKTIVGPDSHPKELFIRVKNHTNTSPNGSHSLWYEYWNQVDVKLAAVWPDLHCRFSVLENTKDNNKYWGM